MAPEGYYIAVSQYEDYYGIYTDKDDKEYVKGMEVIDRQINTPSNVFEMPLDGEYDSILQGQRGMPVISTTVILDRIAPTVEFEGLGRKIQTSKTLKMIGKTRPTMLRKMLMTGKILENRSHG